MALASLSRASVLNIKLPATQVAFKGVEIIEGHLMPDHVHMLVSIPPKISVSNFMGYLKGKSSLMIFEDCPI